MNHAALLLALMQTTDRPLDASELVTRARAALGPFPAAGVELRGEAELLGTRATLRWQIAADGRFRRELVGPLPETSGFDGHVYWQMDAAGVPWASEHFAREYALAESALLASLWAEGKAALDWAPCGTDKATFAWPSGPLTGRLELERSSALPRRWTVPDFSGEAGLELARWSSFHGRAFPTDIHATTPGGGRTRYRIEEVLPLGAADFARPSRHLVGARVAGEPNVPVRRAATGHLFVRPRLQGEDVGWFAFDTGAAVSVIAPEVAARLALPALGRASFLGAGSGVTEAVLRAGGELALGPLVLERVIWSELPEGHALTGLMQLIDEPVVGILGFDVLVRCTAELDLCAGTLALHDAERYALPHGASWEPLLLNRRHPFVRARFAGGHEGWFCLDSGAGVMPVCFHTGTVNALGLLEGVASKPVEAHGAGGPLRLEAGPIAWFEVAGRRHVEPTVLFSRDPFGALADPWSAGTLGHPFFEGRAVVLDYAGGRVAYLAR
jgi:hypothetical protein